MIYLGGKDNKEKRDEILGLIDTALKFRLNEQEAKFLNRNKFYVKNKNQIQDTEFQGVQNLLRRKFNEDTKYKG